MSALFHTPMTRSVFVGHVDASRDREQPTPRTLVEAFGEGADLCPVVPLPDLAAERSDRIVITTSVIALCALGLFALLGWI